MGSDLRASDEPKPARQERKTEEPKTEGLTPVESARNVRRFRRIAIGLLIYTLSTVAFFWITSDADRRGDLRIASVWLLILSAAAAVAWSNTTERLKAAAICSVLLVGASVFTFRMSFIAPRSSDVNPGFVSYLVLLIVGIGGTLGLTWAIERALDWWRPSLHSEDAG
jgi:hypothetical protein